MLTMNGARTTRQISPPSEDISEASDVLTNPSYDIIAGDIGQYTTQYYTTVEPQDSTLSPKDGGSTSDTSSSGRSKSSSTSSDEGSHHHHHHHSRQQDSPTGVQRSLPPTLESTVVPSQQKASGGGMCGAVSTTAVGVTDGSSVKHWSYEEQFKQVCVCVCVCVCWCMLARQ